MNYILKPALEHIALVKVASMLWDLPDIRILINEYCRTPLHNPELGKWQKIEDKTLEKASQLPLPELLKKKICNFLQATSFQILSWLKYHRAKLRFNILPNKFYWLPRGTIDKKKNCRKFNQR